MFVKMFSCDFVAVTVGINLEKASGDKNKKEMLTEESNSERQNTKQDEPSNNPPVGKIPESFAIAKFDYNAQKVFIILE